jgi:fatty-acyl-CoA synthase
MATMRYELTLPAMLERGERFFPRQEIVSRTPSGMFRYTYADFAARVRRLAGALTALGVRRGDRVATLAWNHHRHLEAYFAIPSIGAVLHTLNLRLPPAHLAHVVRHAEDSVILVDPDLIPLLEGIAPELASVNHVVVMDDGDGRATHLPRAASYEAMLAAAEPVRRWAELGEWDPAAMCFSSATTGMPKGVTFTHRAMWLHSLAMSLADTIAVSHRDTILPVVPMFHVNAWGLPFAGVWMGAKLVLPGPRPDARLLCDLIQRERVTLGAGVPTVWMGVLALLEKERYDLSSLTRVVCGGAAPPRALIEAWEKRVGGTFLHAYGMTEAAPLTHACNLKTHMAEWPEGRRYDIKMRQGLLAPGLEMRVVAPAGADVPWDGKTIGELWLRGAWIANEYYQDPRTAETFVDGWYHTGDVATVDAEGYLGIVDRTKDVIKSGGEWISSVELENAIMAHPSVAEASVVGVAHPKWQERPLACVVAKAGCDVNKEEILEHLRQRFPSLWIPDDVVFIQEVPKTSVGKFDKKALRERYARYLTERNTSGRP